VSRGADLLTLQRLDERIGSLRAEVTDLEAALSGDAELDRLRSGTAGAQAVVQSEEVAAKQAELRLAEVRRRARQLERRLYDGSVRNPQDLLGMQRELDALQPQIQGLEARLLERMEAAEGADARLGEARAAQGEREEGRRTQEGPRRERLAAARQTLVETETARAAAAAAALPADVRIYERVAVHWRPAVVRLEGDSCGGCHLPLGIREANLARSGGALVQCSKCDRVVAG
jgi:predicted  nucleic acid-binding Zn-ribbon protein